MSSICEQWLEFKKQDIKESTYIKYRNIISKHIKPIIGHLYINSLHAEDMQKYALLLKNKGLSNKSVRDILAVVSAFFKYAQKIGIYTDNINIEDLYPKAEKTKLKKNNTDSLLFNRPSKKNKTANPRCLFTYGRPRHNGSQNPPK